MYPWGLITGDIEGRWGVGCLGTKSSEVPYLQHCLDETSEVWYQGFLNIHAWSSEMAMRIHRAPHTIKSSAIHDSPALRGQSPGQWRKNYSKWAFCLCRAESKTCQMFSGWGMLPCAEFEMCANATRKWACGTLWSTPRCKEKNNFLGWLVTLTSQKIWQMERFTYDT